MIILQAAGEPMGDIVAAAVKDRLVVRVAVGARRPEILFSMTTLVVWSARAAELGWETFQQFVSDPSQLIAITTDDTPAPPQAFAALRIGPGLATRVDAVFAKPPRGRRTFLSGPARIAAGIMAAIGVFAHAPAQAAIAAPDAVAREASMGPGSVVRAAETVARPAAQADTPFLLSDAVDLSNIAPAVDLDTLGEISFAAETTDGDALHALFQPAPAGSFAAVSPAAASPSFAGLAFGPFLRF